jgi:purine nucleosidase
MKKRRIIIDSDPGIDDCLAILLAIASPELTIDAITIVNGNCSTEQGVRNALCLLELTKRTQIPVASGATVPLVQPLLLAPETHGNTGIGYAQLPEPELQIALLHAVHLLIDRVLGASGEITLVALGPLTNIALAIRIEPQFARAVKEIYIMGGAVRHPGNTTPLAEFNTYCDPHAAKIVYHSGMPITLVPLDVTYQVILTQADVDRLLLIDSPVSRFIAESTRFYTEFHDEHQDIEGCVINDPLVLALCFQSEFVDTIDLHVDVDISGGVSMGKTFADFYHMQGKEPNMKVALDVRPRDFIEFFLGRMEMLARKIRNT